MFVALGLFVNPANNPAFWIIQNSIALFRRYASDHWSPLVLAEAQLEVPRKRKPGFHGALFSRLTEIGWGHVASTSFVELTRHQFDFL